MQTNIRQNDVIKPCSRYMIYEAAVGETLPIDLQKIICSLQAKRLYFKNKIYLYRNQ